MPAFLEKKLKAEYGDNPHAIYGTMNKIGAMKGNKETAKGKAMEKKHEAKMKFERTHIEHLGDGTHVVTHHPAMKPSKSGAFSEATGAPIKYSAKSEELMPKMAEHLGVKMDSDGDYDND
jgi:hypothetical protein